MLGFIMTSFDGFARDTIYIEDDTGKQTGPHKANIGSKDGFSATIFDPTFDIEEGWVLIRELPNGRKEKFTVTETNFRHKFNSIPAHWRIKLQKHSSLIATDKTKQITEINISNSHGIQIGDNNIQQIANSLIGLVQKIESTEGAEEDKVAAKSFLRELISNPIVASILGGATSGIFSLLM